MEEDKPGPSNKFSLFSEFQEKKLRLSGICTQEPVESHKNESDRKSLQVPDSWRMVPESVANAAETKAPLSSAILLVSERQRGNPILTYLKNIPWSYSEIGPDFLFGKDHCGYYLSMRYHNLNPEYITERITDTKTIYSHRILIAHVDMEDPTNVVKDLDKFCFSKNFTLVIAWTNEEVARYIESYKYFENKTLDGLMPEKKGITNGADKVQDDIVHLLTGGKKISKTDAVNMINQFKTVAKVLQASSEQLERIPGFGNLKASKVYNAFNQPFKRKEFL